MKWHEDMKKLDGVDKGVFAHGEVTGHAHRCTDEVYLGQDGLRYVCGETKDVKVTHEEHKPIALTKGIIFASDQIREYDSFAEEARKVRD